MNCGDIDELLPLRHSGELNGTRQKEFDAHMAECDNCASEFRRQADEDVRLRDSLSLALVRESPIAQDLERCVMRRIERERPGRWFALAAAVAATALLATGLLWNAHRHASGPPAVFAAVAHDYTVEIVKNAPRHWRTEQTDIASIEAAEGISDRDVRAMEVLGYRLQKARICRLGGIPYLHAVYSKAERQISVYMKVRGGGNIPENSSSSGSLQLASFTRGPVQAVVVTDAPGSECEMFAHEAAAAF